jgi:hypothetical protein
LGWEAFSLQTIAIFWQVEQLFAAYQSKDAALTSPDFYICFKASFFVVGFPQAAWRALLIIPCYFFECVLARLFCGWIPRGC